MQRLITQWIEDKTKQIMHEHSMKIADAKHYLSIALNSKATNSLIDGFVKKLVADKRNKEQPKLFELEKQPKAKEKKQSWAGDERSSV